MNTNWEQLPLQYLERTYPQWGPTRAICSYNSSLIVDAQYTKRVNDQGTAKLIDVRSPAQFNGTDDLYVVNGHIPKATNLFWKQLFVPISQTPFVVSQVFKPAVDISTLLSTAGFNPNDAIVIYCNSGTEGSAMYFALTQILEYTNVKIFAGSFNVWQTLNQFCPETYKIVT